MEKCLSLDLSVKGSKAFEFYIQPEFTRILSYVRNVTRTLYNENNKKTFRNTCLELASYLIKNKTPSRYYMHEKERWEGALKDRVKSHYKPLHEKFGGCFPIFDENDKKLLNLNYEAENFCEENKNKREDILSQCSNNRHTTSSNCDETCYNRINTYNEWIDNKQKYFKDNEWLVKKSCKNALNQFPKRSCNILDSKTFKKLHNRSPPLPSFTPGQHKIEEEKTSSQEVNRDAKDNLPNPQIPKEQTISVTQGEEAKRDQEIQQVRQPHPQVLSSTEPPGITDKSTEIQDSPSDQDEESEIVSQLKNKGPFPSGPNIPQSPDSQVSLAKHSSETSLLTDEVAVSSSNFPNSMEHPKILVEMFKKKKKIRRRQAKFLRLLVPSFSNNKNKYLTDVHLEYSIYNEEEIKKIKINEFTKNINLSNRKKERSKTIIELHMEVLEEFRKEEWENNKEEFLEICIDGITKKEYITNTNLANDKNIMENIKSSSDIKKQNIHWNKWIERHRNISEKLKNVDWFNNLKNEWKKELLYIQEMEELKKKCSNENYNTLYLEREKNLWKQWISKKAILIDQYLEQDCFKESSEDSHNTSDECLNEYTKSYVSLLNIEEFQHKENYEELYKYIKTKLLTKLGVLVFMTIFEECKKELNFENRESYLDSSINEWKTEEYSDKKQEITKNIIAYNFIDIENKKNYIFHSHIGKHCFSNEIEEYICEDDRCKFFC
ncbi:STP1 protein [Plasmodium brasilianum]|uniref:STP1 protein n=1 Tax=Plasmodium brasilianum TaxID=5824 RepID=A0ACB9Y5J6_PLABR|nr:STP1 protein [Plasmodium brasilianum]